MKIKRTRGERVFGVFNLIFLTLVMVVTLYPFLHVLFASLSNPNLLSAHTGILTRPLGWSLDAYRAVLANPDIYSGYGNTLFLVVVGTACSMLITILSAYVLSRRGYALRRAFNFVATFTMFFSGGLIPFYLQVKALGLLDTRWALIFPTMMSTYNLIVLRTAFSSIPGSLEEAARTDGANDFLILFRVILPLSGPSIAVMVLFYGVGYWNSWFYSMVFLRDRELYPLQLILREILIMASADSMVDMDINDRAIVSQTIKYATIIVSTVPVLLIYPFLQKYFVQGMMIGAVKE